MPSTIQAPYGTWQSPITGDMISADSVGLSGGREVNGSIYWSEMRPTEKGRSTVMRLTAKGIIEELTPIDYNVRTRVHEYGGGGYQIVNDTLYFSNFSDQQLYRRDPSGTISRITDDKKCRFADGCALQDKLIYVMEEHGKEVENCLAIVDPKMGSVRRIAEGHDFYASPRVSSDGRFLAYYCWDHPNMPWDGTELHVAEIKPDGNFGKTRLVSGGVNESIAQPSWGPDNLLYFISDRSGWWNLYRERNGKIEALYPMEAEFTRPQWWFGYSSYAFWKGSKIVCIYSQNGLDFLAEIPIDGGQLKRIEIPFSSIQGLSITGDFLYFVGSSVQTPAMLVKYDLKKGTWKVIKKSQENSLNPNDLSTPQALDFPTTNGLVAHAFYYAPKNFRFSGTKDELPPLLVLSHGGPTAHVTPQFNLGIQYWTSRGFAVIDVNYGGSTGYGRAYRDRLKGNWGVVDVDDCVNAALYCTRNGLADPHRLAIMGGSAGGYTTLAALAFRNVFNVGASFFGVSDIEALELDTHKFESHYSDQLIGPYPEKRDLYLARSPLYHADQIQAPVIFLQGAEDKIVPPAQSEKMYESLVKRGIPTAYLLFEHEQHGFRQAANIKRSTEATSYFFSKILGFSLADTIEPVAIENFGETAY